MRAEPCSVIPLLVSPLFFRSASEQARQLPCASIADTVFLRPLPYKDPEQLMWVAVRFTQMKMEFVASPEYVTWRRDNDVFQSLAATQGSPGQTMLLNGSRLAEIRDARVSANFLRTFGVHPSMGRDFKQAEELPNGPQAVLLTDHLWKKHFHGYAGHRANQNQRQYANISDSMMLQRFEYRLRSRAEWPRHVRSASIHQHFERCPCPAHADQV